ncbi:GNAT family N-acetyltransferase [Ekhidna sp. To15]|uniref:GNAT family N-acetyltransferase n=1 Tax=Ekhidna sp. To15 TaxID=3395267 RepID=UPI003F51B7D7
MDIRKATEKDLDQILELFVGTIQYINAKDYNAEQIAAWSKAKNRSAWLEKLKTQSFFVAHIQDEILGFSSIDAEGYLDFMYVHKDHQRKGIAGLLLERVEKQAKSAKIERIWSSVSITAQPFFSNNGYQHYEDEHKMFSGVHFKNALMEKFLN